MGGELGRGHISFLLLVANVNYDCVILFVALLNETECIFNDNSEGRAFFWPLKVLSAVNSDAF